MRSKKVVVDVRIKNLFAAHDRSRMILGNMVDGGFAPPWIWSCSLYAVPCDSLKGEGMFDNKATF